MMIQNWWWLGWSMVRVVMAQVFIPENGATYNSMLQQVGFCKQQSFDTMSRSTSTAPSVFTSGRVHVGVGLSDVQFQQSIVACGRCIQIIHIEKFYQLNDELTGWDYNQNVDGGFVSMVFDECTDPICTSGFLDFDVYNKNQPVAHGNPINLMWQYVDCPVNEQDKIEFLFCLGYTSCQSHNEEGRSVKSLWQEAQQNDFMVYPRNFRQPIVAVWVQGEPLYDVQSWRWRSDKNDQSLLRNTTWQLKWQSMDGSIQEWALDWKKHLPLATTPGYRGGYIVHTDLQN